MASRVKFSITGNPLRLPEVHLPEGTQRVEDLVSVRLEDPELCPRYTARVIRGVKIGPSPDWLKTSSKKWVCAASTTSST